MKIRLNMKTADHCMKEWFTEGQVYDAEPSRNAQGSAYRLKSDAPYNWPDNYSAKYFDVVEG